MPTVDPGAGGSCEAASARRSARRARLASRSSSVSSARRGRELRPEPLDTAERRLELRATGTAGAPVSYDGARAATGGSKGGYAREASPSDGGGEYSGPESSANAGIWRAALGTGRRPRLRAGDVGDEGAGGATGALCGHPAYCCRGGGGGAAAARSSHGGTGALRSAGQGGAARSVRIAKDKSARL